MRSVWAPIAWFAITLTAACVVEEPELDDDRDPEGEPSDPDELIPPIVDDAEERTLPSTAFPAPIASGASWLTAVNYYRTMAGLPGVTENTTWSAGATKHSQWMLVNGIAHDEPPNTPLYTTEGDAAGNASNVAWSSSPNATPRDQVDLWMTGPWHAIGLLRHNLRVSGHGRASEALGPKVSSAGTLDVIRGIDFSVPRPATPTLFPGKGSTTHLHRFIAETPDPRTLCGWTGDVGLPLVALMPEAVTSATATLQGPSGPIQVCVLSAANTTGFENTILSTDNGVVVLPRTPLAHGLHTASITTNARTTTWSFTVDPAAANSLPVATPAEVVPGTTGLDFLPNAVRLADTRTPVGLTRLAPSTPQKLKVAGTSGLPTDALGLMVTLVAVNPAANGWLSITNCATNGLVANLNFQTGQVVSNLAYVPLTTAGELCVQSNVATDVVIDAVGATRAGASLGFTSTPPTRLLTSIALAAGVATPVQVRGSALAPAGAEAVTLALNVKASTGGYVRAWPCDQPMPPTSSVNYAAGDTRSNLALSRVSAAGTVCLYSSAASTVTADLTGWYTPLASGSPTGSFAAVTPYRLVDTRTTSWAEANQFNGGKPLNAGATYRIAVGGQRGVPTGSAVAANVSVVGTPQAGSLVAWNCSTPVPNTASLSYGIGAARSTMMAVGLDSGGSMCLRATTDAHVIVDVQGVWK